MDTSKDKVIYSRLDTYPRIICVNTPLLTTGIASLWFEAGARYAPENKDGLPHFIEHLFLSRTKQYPNRKKYLMSLDNKGFIYGAYTLKSLVNYYYICLPGNEKKALKHLLTSYQTSIIAQSDITHEKEIVINEEQRNRVSPSNYIWRLADQATWPNSEMSRDIFGTPEIINNFSLEDIANFKQQYYQPDNITIIIASPNKFDVEEIKTIINQLPSTKKNQVQSFESPKIQKRIQLSKKINNLNIAFTYRLNKLSFKEQLIMVFIKHLLTDGWSAKIIQKLHLDKALTYNVSSEVLTESNTGYLRFYWTIKKENLNLSINLIKKEISKLKTQIFSSNLLKTQKRSFLINNLINLNSPYRVLHYYGQFARSSTTKIYTYSEFLNIIQQLKPKNILITAKKHLDLSQTSLATIGKD